MQDGYTRATPADTGVWADGVRGWHTPVRLVERAIGLGYELEPNDRALLAWAQAGGSEPNAAGWDSGGADVHDAWHELQQEVERWLDDHIAPSGHHFGWINGDFVLASDEAWCQWTDGPCRDASHVHAGGIWVIYPNGKAVQV